MTSTIPASVLIFGSIVAFAIVMVAFIGDLALLYVDTTSFWGLFLQIGPLGAALAIFGYYTNSKIGKAVDHIVQTIVARDIYGNTEMQSLDRLLDLATHHCSLLLAEFDSGARTITPQNASAIVTNMHGIRASIINLRVQDSNKTSPLATVDRAIYMFSTGEISRQDIQFILHHFKKSRDIVRRLSPTAKHAHFTDPA